MHFEKLGKLYMDFWPFWVQKRLIPQFIETILAPIWYVINMITNPIEPVGVAQSVRSQIDNLISMDCNRGSWVWNMGLLLTSLQIILSLLLIQGYWQKFAYTTVLPAKSDSDFMFCLQSYQGLIINRSLVY